MSWYCIECDGFLSHAVSGVAEATNSHRTCKGAAGYGASAEWREPVTITLRESDRAKLRDWYDDSGPWPVRMAALYRVVEGIAAKYVDEFGSDDDSGDCRPCSGGAP